MASSQQEPSEGAADSDLERLIETELRLAQLLAAAGSEAKRIVEDARSAARVDEQRTEQELAEAARAARLEMERRRAQEIDAIESRGRAGVAAYDAVTADRVAELAAYVVRRVIGDEA